MTWDCPTCKASWNRHSLSRVNERCSCGEEICPKCSMVFCFDCSKPLHECCAFDISDDYYCAEHQEAAMRAYLVDNCSPAEILVASKAIMAYRKEQRERAA